MTSSLFQDKVYEEMDDFLKLIEPYICETNNDLAEFPDEIVLSFDQVYQLSSSKYGFDSISLDSIISAKAKELNLRSIYENCYDISRKFFEFKSDEDNLVMNLETKTLSGEIKIVKKKIAFEDDELKEKSWNVIRAKILSGLNSNKKMDKRRMNDVADLFNSRETRKDRSWRGKLSCLLSDLRKMWESNKLDIRNYELCEKFGNWIVAYVRNGNLAAYKNLTRIKVMSHQSKPIYSIEEDSIL
jgi:hypothetical protein